ncbi:MAG: hypothetical protein KAR85_04770 [Methanosarcinales archaeon]|nr:hypothetical protein [Methanosarcinales archaeon]
MKILNPVLFIIVSSILILMLLISPVYAYADSVSDGTDGESIMGGVVTSYGADVIIVRHLIEVDQVSNPDYLKVDETLVFRNIGTGNYTGSLYAWLPNGAFNVGLAKLEMTSGGQIRPLDVFIVNDNVIGWNDEILAGSVMTPMYRLQYMVPAEPTGKMTESLTFTKKLKYPTNVNYDYIPSSGMPVLIVKLVKSDDLTTSVVNEDGSKIEADFVDVVEGSNTYNWVQPQFVEISFTLSRSSIDQSDVSIYLLLLLVIILVIGIPVLRGKTPYVKGLDEKTSKAGPKKEDEDIYLEQEFDEEFEEEIETSEDTEEDGSDVPALNEEDIKSFDIDELKSAKSALLKVLSELDEDYADGALSEEEYNSIRDKYKQKVIGIMKQIDVLEEKSN